MIENPKLGEKKHNGNTPEYRGKLESNQRGEIIQDCASIAGRGENLKFVQFADVNLLLKNVCDLREEHTREGKK